VLFYSIGFYKEEMINLVYNFLSLISNMLNDLKNLFSNSIEFCENLLSEVLINLTKLCFLSLICTANDEEFYD